MPIVGAKDEGGKSGEKEDDAVESDDRRSRGEIEDIGEVEAALDTMVPMTQPMMSW